MFKVAFAFLSLCAFAWGVDPSTLKLKVYGAWISKSDRCTDPVKIFSTSDPIYLNFLGNPGLGSLDNTDGAFNGTYRCVIFRISEIIHFVPASNNGYCSEGTEYSTRLCSAGQTTVDPETHEEGSCANGSVSDDVVFLYLSTLSTATSTATSTGPFLPPTTTNTSLGLKLDGAMGVNGARTAKFVVDAYDKIESSGTTCRLNTPIFSFVPTN